MYRKKSLILINLKFKVNFNFRKKDLMKFRNLNEARVLKSKYFHKNIKQLRTTNHTSRNSVKPPSLLKKKKNV